MTQPARTVRPKPFYEASHGGHSHPRRLLLISFVFPPAQASGSLRWQKLSHFVSERGWGLDVITLDPSCLDAPDADRLTDLAPGTRVYGVPAARSNIDRAVRATWRLIRWLRSRLRRSGTRQPTPLAKARTADASSGSIARRDVRWNLGSLRGFIRAYSTVRDVAESGRWARDAAALALRLFDPAVHEAVITSGPPHMAHEAGRLVSRRTQLPFVMDMRDPWSHAERLIDDFATPLWLDLAASYERRSVRQAALVVANTEPLRVAMCNRYPEAADRVVTVMNGCDEGRVPTPRRSERFLIAYAGSIYLDRDPSILFRALARFVREMSLTPAQVGLEFIGHVDRYGATPVMELAAKEGVSEYVRVEPPRPHRAALEFLAQASVLVSLPQDNHLAIPAKIFDYARFEAWVLVLAIPESATGLLLRDSSADVVAPDDLDGIVRVLRTRFLDYRRGVCAPRLAAEGRFSRRAQADILLNAIARCTTRNQRTDEVSAAARSRVTT